MDDAEAQITQEIKILRNILAYVDRIIDIMKAKSALYGSIDEYTPQMIALKAYTKCGYLYNNYSRLSDNEKTEVLCEIGLYHIMLVEHFESKVWNDTNYIGAKYINIINKTYQSRHNEYNSKYKIEEILTPEEIAALILMKSIRIKNLTKNNCEDHKIVEAILDNAKDTLVFCYIIYDRISNDERHSFYMSI